MDQYPKVLYTLFLLSAKLMVSKLIETKPETACIYLE